MFLLAWHAKVPFLTGRIKAAIPTRTNMCAHVFGDFPLFFSSSPLRLVDARQLGASVRATIRPAEGQGWRARPRYVLMQTTAVNRTAARSMQKMH